MTEYPYSRRPHIEWNRIFNRYILVTDQNSLSIEMLIGLTVVQSSPKKAHSKCMGFYSVLCSTKELTIVLQNTIQKMHFRDFETIQNETVAILLQP